MLTTRYYGLVDADGFITQTTSREEEHDAELAPFARGQNYLRLPGPIDWGGQDTPTSKLLYMGSDVQPEWVETGEIEHLRSEKVLAMNRACTAQIVSGFVCSALGEPHTYPSDHQDQSNLLASVTDSLLAGADPSWTTPFKCADASGVWLYRPHTVAQIQQVGREGKASILIALAKNELLREEINSATAEQLSSISW